MQRKEYARAASAYELALGLNPLYPEAWFSQGYCYLRIGENTKALQVSGLGSSSICCFF
jgi:tetratricopeptide (TPR) repeat protein